MGPLDCWKAPEPSESRMTPESGHRRGIARVFIGHGVLCFKAVRIYRTKRSVIDETEFGLVPDGIPNHPNPFVECVVAVLQIAG